MEIQSKVLDKKILKIHDIPAEFGTGPALRELHLGRQMELEHVLGRVSYDRNPVHTPGALPAAISDARDNIPWISQNIPKIHTQV